MFVKAFLYKFLFMVQNPQPTNQLCEYEKKDIGIKKHVTLLSLSEI